MQIGDIDAKIAMLTGLTKAAGVPGASKFVNDLNENAETAKGKVDKKTAIIQEMKLNCYKDENAKCDDQKYR